MNVVWLVGTLMMQPMMRRPPQCAALHRGRTDNGEGELAGARSLERAMRKVAMVKAGDREHPDEIHRDGDADRNRAPADPDHPKAHQMDDDVGDASEPVGLLRQGRGGNAPRGGVKPSRDRNEIFSGCTRGACRHSVSPPVRRNSCRTASNDNAQISAPE